MTTTAVWGHRGASATCPENTIAAFVEAAAQGADGVELDVRRTRDGALVVVHDAFVAGLGAVSELGVSDLPSSVPLLDAALDACFGAGLATVNVEIKNLPNEPGFDSTAALASAVAATVAPWLPGVVVSCFHLPTVDAVLAIEPTARTGWLTLLGFDQYAALETVVAHGHGALHPEQAAIDLGLCAAARERGIAVHAWTVDDPDRAAELAAMGVDALITNDPAKVRACL